MSTRCNICFYCRSYCLINIFQAPLFPSSGAREYYTVGCCLWYLVLWFSNCRYGVELTVMCPVCGLARSSAWRNKASTGRIFTKFGIWVFFENLSTKFKFHWNLTGTTGTLHEDLRTFMIVPFCPLLRMKNISDKVVEKIKTPILYSIPYIFFWK
jgi:hypothetical protein